MKTQFIALMVLISSVAFAQAPASEVAEHCGDHPNLVVDSSNQPKWHTPEEMDRLVVQRVTAEKAQVPGVRYKGAVTIKVLVNTSGNVSCMWNAAGHPVMIPNAVRAVHEWKFKPMTEAGKPREFLGTVRIEVSSST